MKKKPPRAKRSRPQGDAGSRIVLSDKVTIAKPPKTVSKEKDEPIKWASPPCYLAEIED